MSILVHRERYLAIVVTRFEFRDPDGEFALVLIHLGFTAHDCLVFLRLEHGVDELLVESQRQRCRR